MILANTRKKSKRNAPSEEIAYKHFKISGYKEERKIRPKRIRIYVEEEFFADDAVA